MAAIEVFHWSRLCGRTDSSQPAFPLSTGKRDNAGSSSRRTIISHRGIGNGIGGGGSSTTGGSDDRGGNQLFVCTKVRTRRAIRTDTSSFAKRATAAIGRLLQHARCYLQVARNGHNQVLLVRRLGQAIKTFAAGRVSRATAINRISEITGQRCRAILMFCGSSDGLVMGEFGIRTEPDTTVHAPPNRVLSPIGHPIPHREQERISWQVLLQCSQPLFQIHGWSAFV